MFNLSNVSNCNTWQHICKTKTSYLILVKKGFSLKNFAIPEISCTWSSLSCIFIPFPVKDIFNCQFLCLAMFVPESQGGYMCDQTDEQLQKGRAILPILSLQGFLCWWLHAGCNMFRPSIETSPEDGTQSIHFHSFWGPLNSRLPLHTSLAIWLTDFFPTASSAAAGLFAELMVNGLLKITS